MIGPLRASVRPLPRVSMRLVPFALMPSSPRSPLLVAYNLYSQAEFAECLAELAGLSPQLAGTDGIEAALLRARSFLRLDRPTEAGSALEFPLEALDDDLRCTVQALRGFALVSAGRHLSGMQMIDTALERARIHDVHDSVRLEALYHRAFAHWLTGKYDEAEADAIRSCETQIDGVCARAVALRGWIRIGHRRHGEALPFFRSAAGTFSASLVRDAAFEASVVHALANYEWEVLDQAGSRTIIQTNCRACPVRRWTPIACSSPMLMLGVQRWKGMNPEHSSMRHEPRQSTSFGTGERSGSRHGPALHARSGTSGSPEWRRTLLSR